MKNELAELKKISVEYKDAVDELSSAYEYQVRYAEDHLYNDAERERRVAARNADFNGKICALAQKAQADAAQVISQLREEFQEYITTSTNPATIQTVSALLSAGVELSNMEITAFAENGGYGVLRLLEKPSKGHIKAPDPATFEREVSNLERHFRDISSYRGALAAISTERPWGQGPSTGNAIMKEALKHFPEKLDEMAQHWAFLER